MQGTLNKGGSKNVLLNTTMLSREALFRLKNQIYMPRLCDRSLESYFEGNIGRSVSIKKPFQAMGSPGRVLTDAQINPLIDEVVTLTLNKRWKFSLGNINDENLSMELVNFGNHYLQAGVEEVAEYVDEECLKELTLNIPAVAVAGRAGDINADNTITGDFIGNSLTTEMAMYVRAHATEIAIPQNSMNYAILDPNDIASLGHDLKSVFVPEWVRGILKTKFRGQMAQWNTFESVKIPNYVVANPGLTVGVINSSGGYQGDTLPTDGWTASSAVKRILNKGQMICIAGVFEVNPRGSRMPTGRLKSFTVLEDVDLAINATSANIKVYPELNAGTGVLNVTDGDGNNVSKNALKNVSAGAVDNAQVYLVGKKGKTYRQSVFYEKRALTFAPVRLKKLGGGIDSAVATDPRTNLSISINHQAELKTMDVTYRGDTMFGVLCQYPELGLRVLTAEI